MNHVFQRFIFLSRFITFLAFLVLFERLFTSLGNGVAPTNEVDLQQTGLVLRRVTVRTILV